MYASTGTLCSDQNMAAMHKVRIMQVLSSPQQALENVRMSAVGSAGQSPQTEWESHIKRSLSQGKPPCKVQGAFPKIPGLVSDDTEWGAESTLSLCHLGQKMRKTQQLNKN